MCDSAAWSEIIALKCLVCSIDRLLRGQDLGAPMDFFDCEDGRVINVANTDNSKLPFHVQEYNKYWRCFEETEEVLEDAPSMAIDPETTGDHEVSPDPSTIADSSSSASSSSSTSSDSDIPNPEEFVFGPVEDMQVAPATNHCDAFLWNQLTSTNSDASGGASGASQR